MKQIKFFDVAEMVVSAATEDFGENYRINADLMHNLKKVCDMLDKFALETGGVAYEVSIDDATLDITLSLHCEDLDIVGAENIFYDLIKASKKYQMEMSTENSENVCVSFVVSGVWHVTASHV